MRFPKPENWTLHTSERLISHLENLYERYESKVEFDDNGNIVNKEAEELYLKGLRLQDELPVNDKEILKYHNLFR